MHGKVNGNDYVASDIWRCVGVSLAYSLSEVEDSWTALMLRMDSGLGCGVGNVSYVAKCGMRDC